MLEQEARTRIEKVLGHLEFPLHIDFDNYGVVTGIRYDSSWKVGGTEPIENEAGEVIDYKENYTDKSLSKQECARLDAEIASIMGA